MRDVENKQDLEKIIRSFYFELLKDHRMQEPFRDLDFEKHIPHIVSFWAFVVFDEEGYKTNVFEKHRSLPIQPFMFDIWLNVWKQTIQSLFNGPAADLLQQRAEVLAFTFKSKWEILFPNK